MADVSHRWDAWAQWAGVVLLLLTAFWNLAGRLSRIEQQLADDTAFHQEATSRLEFIEREVLPYVMRAK